jgi:hypothetical protein
MRERTQNQKRTDEEQAQERAEFVDFQYGVRDLVLRLGTALSSLVVFGGVLYLAGGLHAWAYFSAFGASWLVLELPGNSFPFRVLSLVFILIFGVSVGARLVYEGSKRKWSWVVNLISRHVPHKESSVGHLLLILSVFLTVIILNTPLFPLPWMVTYSYWSYGISALCTVVFVAWAVVFVLGPPSSKREIVTGVLAIIVVVPTMLVLSFWRPLVEGYTTITRTIMGGWGVLFGIGVGARVLADLAHSNGGSLLKYSIPSPRGGWSAANAFPLHLAFFVWFSLFSITDGSEQGLYDQGANRSTLPIVVLEGGDPSCRQALLITSSRVYTVTLQSLQPLKRRPDVVPFSWEKISRIQAPEFGRCLDSLPSSYGSVPVPF